MKKTQSIILQEYYQTLERNKAIKFRWEHTPKEERWGLLAEMGRQYNRSRERIRKIVNNPNVTLDRNYLQAPPNQRQPFYLLKLITDIYQKLQNIF